MSVGLPGTGIGGVFYLLSALCMPVAAVADAVRRGRVSRVRLVARQLCLAVAIIAALFATGWALEWLLIWLHTPAALAAAGQQVPGARALPAVFRTTTFVLTFGTLLGVLGTVQVLRFFVAVQRTPKSKDANSARPCKAA